MRCHSISAIDHASIDGAEPEGFPNTLIKNVFSFVK